MMSKICLCIPSYNRPNGQTLQAIMKEEENFKDLTIRIFVYQFDEHLQEYMDKYGKYLHIIPKDRIEKPNLPNKRQYILDWAVENEFNYMISIDDDDETYLRDGKPTSLSNTIFTWLYEFRTVYNSLPDLIMCEASFRDEDNKSVLYNNLAGSHSIFVLKNIRKAEVKYNPESKCEDAEFSIETILKGYRTCRIRRIALINDLFGVRGSDKGGLSYRFEGTTDRLATEANYIYDKYKDKYPLAFEIKNDRPKFRPALYVENYVWRNEND